MDLCTTENRNHCSPTSFDRILDEEDEDVGRNLFNQFTQQMKRFANVQYEQDEGYVDDADSIVSPETQSASLADGNTPDLAKNLKRRRRCGVCGPCLVKENCEQCLYCIKRSTMKQACIRRRCIEITKFKYRPKRRSDPLRSPVKINEHTPCANIKPNCQSPNVTIRTNGQPDIELDISKMSSNVRNTSVNILSPTPSSCPAVVSILNNHTGRNHAIDYSLYDRTTDNISSVVPNHSQDQFNQSASDESDSSEILPLSGEVDQNRRHIGFPDNGFRKKHKKKKRHKYSIGKADTIVRKAKKKYMNNHFSNNRSAFQQYLANNDAISDLTNQHLLDLPSPSSDFTLRTCATTHTTSSFTPNTGNFTKMSDAFFRAPWSRHSSPFSCNSLPHVPSLERFRLPFMPFHPAFYPNIDRTSALRQSVYSRNPSSQPYLYSPFHYYPLGLRHSLERHHYPIFDRMAPNPYIPENSSRMFHLRSPNTVIQPRFCSCSSCDKVQSIPNPLNSSQSSVIDLTKNHNTICRNPSTNRKSCSFDAPSVFAPSLPNVNGFNTNTHRTSVNCAHFTQPGRLASGTLLLDEDETFPTAKNKQGNKMKSKDDFGLNDSCVIFIEDECDSRVDEPKCLDGTLTINQSADDVTLYLNIAGGQVGVSDVSLSDELLHLSSNKDELLEFVTKSSKDSIKMDEVIMVL